MNTMNNANETHNINGCRGKVVKSRSRPVWTVFATTTQVGGYKRLSLHFAQAVRKDTVREYRAALKYGTDTHYWTDKARALQGGEAGSTEFFDRGFTDSGLEVTFLSRLAGMDSFNEQGDASEWHSMRVDRANISNTTARVIMKLATLGCYATPEKAIELLKAHAVTYNDAAHEYVADPDFAVPNSPKQDIVPESGKVS